ncbi:MAG: tRNA-guanine transglycosylase, partial [Candidatus Competibacteraceae bacterium]|nr:tRNA-guanine transglycosylase [Candidatus Competibacteraceae bacterium]
RGYMRHLVKAGEMLAPMLATYHNLAFMFDLMEGIRAAIESGSFIEFKARFLERYTAADVEREADPADETRV